MVGDDVAIATLLDAAKTLVTTDPETAAQFGQRALEIAPPHHPQRGEIVATTAIALHITGNSERAIAFADRALRETLPTLQEAEVRLSIAGMFAISPEIRIGAGRLALNLPELPETLRARHLACLFHNLVTAGRLDEARAVLDETRAMVESADDARATFTLRVAESALASASSSRSTTLNNSPCHNVGEPQALVIAGEDPIAIGRRDQLERWAETVVGVPTAKSQSAVSSLRTP